MNIFDFDYKLVKIHKISPKPFNGPFDGKIFRYEFDQEMKNGNGYWTVSSEVFADLDGLKVFASRSEYLIYAEQQINEVIGNYFLTELIYQHLCRETDMIYNISQGKILLTPPTLRAILDSLTFNEN